MTLITRTQSKSCPYYQWTPSPSEANGLVTCAQTALVAHSKGLVNPDYFDNGRKQSIKGAKNLLGLMRSGFALLKVNGEFFLTRGLRGGSPIAELLAKLEAKPATQRSVFISYQWKHSNVVDEIQKVFEDLGYLVIRDKKDLSNGNSLTEFMELINHPKVDYVISVISDSYLKSENCMFEVSQMLQKYKFKDVVLAYVVSEDQNEKVQIYKDADRQKYIDYWKNSSSAQADKIGTITSDLSKFLTAIADKVNPAEKILRETQYQPFIDMITDREKVILQPSKAPTSIEQKLEKLKDQVLNDEDIEKDLAAYVPVNIDLAVNAFLAGNQRVFLLLGDSGMGKSTYLRYLENRLWEVWNPEKPIPIFINLPALKHPFYEAITETLKEKGFTDPEIKILKNKYSFLFLLDGYDQLKQKKNIYETNQLDEWKGQTIFSCLTQYLTVEWSHIYRKYFAPPNQDANSVTEASLAPFTPQQVEAYCHRYIQLNDVPRTLAQYQSDIALMPSGLADLVGTPSLLRIVVEVLPDIIEAHRASRSQEQLKIRRIDIFDTFIKNWFDRQEKRIRKMGTEVDISNLKDNFTNFSTQLALEMAQDNIVSVDYKYDQFKPSKWDTYFGSDQKAALFRSGVPLRKIGPNSYTFIHKSLLEYFVARAIIPNRSLSSATLPESISYDNLSKKILSREPKIISLLAECVTKDPSLTDQLFEFIERSKHDPQAATAASNAITILNAAQINLSGRNFKGIRIPEADLSRALMVSTDLSHANLRNVKLNEAYLEYSTIAFSEAAGLELGQKPFIPNVYDMVVSPDGKSALVSSQAPGLRDCQTGRPLLWFNDGDSYSKVAYSLDGKSALSAHGWVLSLWDCQTGKKLRSFHGHTGIVNCVAFSPNSERVLSGSEDKTVRLWDCNTGKELRSFSQNGRASNVAFSPDGKWALSDDWDIDHYILRVWDCKSGNALRSFRAEGLMQALSSNGQWALCSSWEFPFFGDKINTIVLWDCQTGKKLRSFYGHTGNVNCVAFSSDGQWALSGSDDKTVRLWNCQTGKQIYCLTLGFKIKHVRFLPDGKEILISTDQPALQGLKLFDEQGHFHPIVKWSAGKLAFGLSIEGIKNLSESNRTLFLEHGAIEQPQNQEVFTVQASSSSNQSDEKNNCIIS